MKSAKDPRHIARMLAVMDLYESDFTSGNSKLPTEELELGNYSKQIRENIFKGVKENLALVNSIIDDNSKPIKIDDLDLTLQEIIRLSVFEGFIAKTIPPKVSVDEAIELARDFGYEGAVRKVSGILGKIFEVKKAEFAEEEK